MHSLICCTFQPGFGCYTFQTLVEICFFNIFWSKKLKKGEKARNLIWNLAKNGFFKFAPKCWSSELISIIYYFNRKTYMDLWKTYKPWTLVGPTRENLVSYPLAMISPKNQLCITPMIFFQSFLSCRASALNHWDGHDKNWNQAFLIALTRDPPIVFRYQGHL